MKWKAALLFALPFTCILSAQPTVTRDDLISPGDMYQVANVEEIPDPGAGGADVIWDFSAVMASAPVQYSAVSPGNTPFGAMFPSSNLAVLPVGGQIYQYFTITNDVWEEEGFVRPLFASLTYEDPRVYLRLPMTFQDIWEDVYSYTLAYQVDPPFTAFGEGSLQAVVDGYGTLILPQGTFGAALRVRIIGASQDTADIIPGIITERNIYQDTSYLWYSPDHHAALCTYSSGTLQRITTAIQGGDTTTTEESDAFLSFTIDPSAEPPVSAAGSVTKGPFDLEAWPNPFVETLYAAFDVNPPQDLVLELRGCVGTIIYRESITAQAGLNNLTLRIPELPEGAYYVMLRGGSGISVRKLIRAGR